MGLRRGNITATADANAGATKLPARFARLTGYLAVILIRKSLATSAASATAVSTAAPITAGTAIAGAAARSTWTAGFRLGPSFVDLEIAAAEVFAVERGDSLGRIRVIDHFHEAEAARFPGFAVGSHMYSR
jgi:hypothetical protein